MCLSKAYVDRNGKRELLMEDIASLEFGDDKLLFKTIFGEQKEVEGSIKEINFLSHSIVLENLRGWSR